MAINAELFDGTRLEFPDGTDPSVIQATARRITLERQMEQGGEPRRNDLGEIQPRGSMAYEAISKVADVARPYVEPVTDYIGEQASLLSGAAQKGYANLKTSAKQSQVAGLMELQEARKATYGTFENMPPKEQENYIKAQKAIEEKLGEVAGLGVEKQNIDKEYGVRASSKAFNEISNLKEYKEGSFFDKMGLIGSGLAKDPIGIITDLGVESLPQSLAVAATAVAARTGQLNPKIAAGLGGSTSAMMEFGNVYADLRGQGMDHIEAWEKAGVKSGIVGLFDAASFYSAGKAAGDIVNNIQKGAVKETVKTVAKETGKQGALGAGGEGVGSATIGQEVDPLELTKEAIGEIFGAPGDAIGTYQSKVAEARAAGLPDPVPPVDVKKMMSDKGFSFKPRTTIEQDLQGMDVIYPEDTQAAAPSDVIEIKGVGRNPDEVAPATEEELIGDLEASQDRRAMLAELEDESAQERELKQVTVQEPEPEAPAAEKAPEFAKAVNVKDFNPEDKAAIRSMEVERNKINKEKKLFPEFLKRQGVQPSEKKDLGLDGLKRIDIFRQSAPSFDELTSRAIQQGFLVSTGDDVQDVENMREHVSNYIGNKVISTGPDVAREGQLRSLDDAIQEIVRKYDQPKTNLADEARAIADQFAQIGQTGPAQAIVKGIEDGQTVTPATIEFLRGKLQELSQPAPMELTGQTPDEARAQAADLEKQQADEQRAELEKERAEKATRDRAEIKQRSEAAADDFQLGQTAEDNLTGQKDVFAEPVVKAEKPRKIEPQNFDQDEINEVARIIRRGGGLEYNENAYPLLKKMEKVGLIDLKGKGKIFISKEARKAGIRDGGSFSPFPGSNDMKKLEAFIKQEKPQLDLTEDPDADIPFAKATMEQQKDAETVANNEGGKVVWQEGDLSLIETTSGSGKVIYKGAKGTVYPRFQVDISEFKGDWIPADKVSEMRKIANTLRKESIEKGKTPFIKYDNGVAFSDSVDKSIAGIVKEWKKLLNITNDVYITTFADVKDNFDKFTGEEVGIRKALKNDGSANGTTNLYGEKPILGKSRHYIAFNKNTSKTRMLEILAHELGHIHEKVVFDSAPAETKDAIKAEFAKWVESQKGKTARELLNSLRALQLSKSVKIRNEQMMVEDLEKYWTSFAEWYADQVSRWSTTSDKPLSVVDKFFAKIAETLRNFYTSLKGQGYLPNETFKKYLDEAAVNLNLVPEIADVGEQLSLFAESEMKAKDQTSTPAFKKWFGDSKVVDENGKPLVVYHGTDKADFSIFDPASWFTDNAKEASAYAQTDLLRKRERLLGKYKLSDDTSAVGKTVPFASVLSDIGDLKLGEYYAEGGFDGPVYKYLGKNKYEVLKNVVVDLDTANLRNMTVKLKEGQSKEAVDQVNETKEYADTFEGGEMGRVYPSYLSIKNPLYLDAFQVNNFSQRLGKSKEEIQAQVDKWKSQGYDGIITDSDEARFFPEVREEFEGIPKQYIPFDSTQIKSATGNIGTFDETNPDIARNITLKRSKFTEKFLLPAEYVQDDTRAPSLRVNLKRLVRQFKNGTMAPETFSMRVENAIDETKPKEKAKPRVRGPDIIREKLLAAKRRGELTEEAVDLAEWFISRNPALFENLGISIKQPKEGSSTAGYYNPMERVFTLMKYSNNDETAVHEMLHHMERMMPDNVQDGIRKSWFTSLAKAAKEAQKGTDKNLQDYYTALIDYHTTGSRESLKTVKQLLDNGDVGYEHYQHYNASEFFAVNAADIVAGRYAQSKSIVGKLKQWLKELGQKLKALFRLQSSAPILRALDSLAKSDGKYVSTVMISDTTDFMDRKNYKGGKAPLSAWNDPQESKLDNFLYKVQDKLIDTKRVQQAIEQQVGEIEDNWNAYMKEELYHGRTAKRTQDFLKNELSPIVKELAKANIDIGEFDQFLHNRHAEERNVQIAKINPAMPDAGSGIATADAQQYMKDLDPTKRKLLEKLADKIDSMVKGTQKILIDSGLEEQSTIDVWNKTYKHYVPLKREDVDFVHTGTGLGQGFATRGGTSARATGSLKNVAEIFGNLALQRERAIIRAEKARVGKAMYGLAIKNPNPDFWLPVNPDAIKNKAKLEQELVNMGLDPIDAKNLIQEPRQQYIDPRTGLVAYRVNPVLRSSDNVFPVRINGQDRFIFFNSSNERAMRMVSAIKNLDADQLGIVMNVTSNVTRWLASVNTQYNPVFGAINFFRDVQGAALNLSTTPLANKKKEVLAGTLPALRGIYQDLRDGKGGMWADLFEDYQLAGGQTGYRDQFSRNRRQASIVEREMGAMKRGNVKKAAYAVAQWLSDYNDAMENAVRLSAYKTALDMGLSKEKAASIAKNLTVNFNRKGTYAQTVGALYAFFNASVQGTARLAETMKGPAGRKIFYGGLALGSLQAVALLAAGFDDDEPPEFIKSRNIIIPTGGKKYIAIPMPLGFNMFPNLGRLTTEFVLSGGKKPAEKTLDIVSMVFNTFNPIGGSGLQLVSPTIVDPIAALYTNVDAFGRPISKEDRKTSPTPGYARSREQASTVSKYIVEFLNYASGGTKYQKGAVSPTADQLDYLVGQATGGVGRETAKAVGAVKSVVTGEELPSYKVPIAGKFYGNTESPANIASKFYDNVTQLANYENEIKGRQKNRENVGQFLREHPEARLYQRANQLENQISQINKDKKALIERKAPQKQIDVLDKRKTMMMDKFNKDYKKASK